MGRVRRAAIAAAFAVVAAAGVSAGCGGGSSLALDPVAAAATKTQQAGAARIRFALTLSGPRTHKHTVRLSGIGAIDGTSSELTVGLGGLAGQSFLPAIVANASLKAISLEEHGDEVVYLRPGFLASQIPGGKTWVKLNLSNLGQAVGLGSLLAGSQVSPADLLSMLKAEGAKMRNLGAATVGGVATTHYRITVDVAKTLKASGLASPLIRQTVAKSPAVPVDVWIGKDGLLRRIQLSFRSSHERRFLGMTLDIYDYGAHVTIAAPPSRDVFDATQLAQQGFGSAFSH